MRNALLRGEVVDRRAITPGMVRVTLGGPGIAAFESTGSGDEYVRMFFPDRATGADALPEIREDGSWHYREGEVPALFQPYTIRAHDSERAELTIDFVIHAGGVASAWAQRAEPGDSITFGLPRELTRFASDARRFLFIADAPGLPALARLLEELPREADATALVELGDPSHQIALATEARLTVTWLRGGNGVAASGLPDAVEGIGIGADTHVWIAGERRMVRRLRRHFRTRWGLDRARLSAVAYWIDRLPEWRNNWNALDATVKAELEAVRNSRRDDAEDEVEAILERHGL